MEKDLVAVLGAGNGGHAVAANLSVSGFKVNFFELPQFAQSFEKVLRTKEIQIQGISIDGTAKLNLATIDIQQAIKDAEIIFVVTPAFGHKAMAEACAPFVKKPWGQATVIRYWHGLPRDELCHILDLKDGYVPNSPGETFLVLGEKEEK